jgi:hypothetical protein
MPLKSKSQHRWMRANNPKMAALWAKETPSLKKLPERVRPPSSSRKKRR